MSSSPSRQMKIGDLRFAVSRRSASGTCSAFPAMARVH